MTILTDLIDYLESQLTDVTFIATQAQPGTTSPYVEITQDNHQRIRTTKLTSANKITDFEIECWHTNTVNAQALAAQVSALLQDFRGIINSPDGKFVWRTKIFNEFDGSDSAAELFNSSFSVTFTHT